MRLPKVELSPLRAVLLLLAGVAAVLTFFALQGPALIEQKIPESDMASSHDARSERRLGEARNHLAAGRYAEARKLLDRLLESEFHPHARIERAKASIHLGDLRFALLDLEKVGDEDARLAAEARFLEGDIMLRTNLARQAERKWLAALASEPRHEQARARLIELYLLQRRREDLLSQLGELRTLRKLHPHELAQELLAGEPLFVGEAARNQLASFAACDPADVESRIAIARLTQEAGRPEEALKLLHSLAGEHPTDTRIAGYLASGLIQASRLKEAADLLGRFEIDSRASTVLWRSAGDLAFEMNEMHRAVRLYRAFLETHANDLTCRYRLAIAFRSTGSEELAEDLLRETLAVDRAKQAASRALASRVATPIPNEPVDPAVSALVEVGEILAELGRWQNAKDWFEAALTLNASHRRGQEGLRRANREITQGRVAGDAAVHLSADSNAPDRGSLPRRWPPGRDEPNGPGDSIMTRIRLRDVHSEAGLNFRYFNGETGFKYLIESMGGGVATFDFDLDGWPDVYFTQGCRLPYVPQNLEHLDAFFRNLGNGDFADVSQLAGIVENQYGQGCVAGDLNEDGFPDLAVANFGSVAILINNGDGTFTNQTLASGITGERMYSSVALGDLDRDGDLEIYVVGYLDSLKACRDASGRYRTCELDRFTGEQDRLYLNLGDGRFADITHTSGVAASNGKGLGVVIANLDDDLWPDIYVANDETPNFLFRNASGEVDSPARCAGASEIRMIEQGLISGAAVSGAGRAQAGMGIACADFDGDQSIDLLVTNFYRESATLYLNRGSHLFQDATRASGLARPTEHTLGFGAQAADFDLDGDPDLFIANGHIDNFEDQGEPWMMPPHLFVNDGRAAFVEVSHGAGDYFQGKYLGRGVARWDWNRDGRPDLVVVNQYANAALLSNESETSNRSAAIRLHGVRSNRDAIGARVEVVVGQKPQVFDVTGGDGFFASNERRYCVGVGDAERIDSLLVRWPSGEVGEYQNLPSDCEITIVEGREPRLLPFPKR